MSSTAHRRSTVFGSFLGALLVAGAVARADTPAPPATGDQPPYPHGEFSEDCAMCHQSERWRPATISPRFRHEERGFELEGAHRATPCRACHATLDFSAARTDCAECHADVHRGELGTVCGACHTPRSFIDRSAQLRAHVTTRFPLTGAHVTLDCRDCHALQPQGALRFVNTPADCQACHLSRYLATTDPNHQSANFPRDCSLCHSSVAWERARFDHASTAFPLTGAHRSATCAACHPDNSYQATPTDCYACHRSDYEGATEPNHVALALPTDCALCHSTTSFGGASFTEHDTRWFPIYSGAHLGRWDRCSDCHVNAGNYSQFSCFACHGTAETDGHHDEVSGYVYDSAACYSCHPDGRH